MRLARDPRTGRYRRRAVDGRPVKFQSKIERIDWLDDAMIRARQERSETLAAMVRWIWGRLWA